MNCILSKDAKISKVFFLSEIASINKKTSTRVSTTRIKLAKYL